MICSSSAEARGAAWLAATLAYADFLFELRSHRRHSLRILPPPPWLVKGISPMGRGYPKVVNTWELAIEFTGSPPTDANWAQAVAIVSELKRRDARVAERVGSFWPVDYGTTDESLEEAIKAVEQALAEVNETAPELLRVTLC
jgi:hypothetical protein